MLHLTNKTVLEVFTLWQVDQLKKENNELKLALYHERLPTLRDCMYNFNIYGTKNVEDDNDEPSCKCLACCDAGRVEDVDDSDPDDDDDDKTVCMFKIRWERFLVRMKADWNSWNEDLPRQLDPEFRHYETIRCIGMPTQDNWCFSGWGKPLTSLDSPRREIWDNIVRETRPCMHDHEFVCTH